MGDLITNALAGQSFQEPECVGLHSMVAFDLSPQFYLEVCDFERQGPNLIAVFGGFSFNVTFQDGYNLGSGPLVYTNQLALFDINSQRWAIVNGTTFNEAGGAGTMTSSAGWGSTASPSPRGGHASGALMQPSSESFMVMMGGTNTTHTFDDVWLLSGNINLMDLNTTLRWREAKTSSSIPSRWGHALGVVNSSAFVVFGGFSSPLGEFYMHPRFFQRSNS